MSTHDDHAPPSTRSPGAVLDAPRMSLTGEEGALLLSLLVRFIEGALAQGAESKAVIALGRRVQVETAVLARAVGGELRVGFTEDALFVGGRPIHAPREVYAPALELGRLFMKHGVVELGFRADLGVEALLALAELLAAAIRDPGRPSMTSERIDGIVLRAGEPPHAGPATPFDRALDVYLAGLSSMRAFHDTVAAGGVPGTREVKRLAQELVSLLELGDGVLLGLTALASTHRDDAGRSIHAAILALVSASQLTDARVALSRLAMAALFSGAGRASLATGAGRGGAARLADEQDGAVPAMTALVSLAAGEVNRSSALRTTTAWEAAWLPREAKLGPLYRGRLPPLWQSRILRMSCAFLERTAPREGARTASALEALEELARAPAADRPALRLLAGALLAGALLDAPTAD